ncbi:hypothetical protein RKLH11_2518 [Rhodobacteraceae bacterium KLH11]|nr:hypothetical protein RKLH11_2518 [Rhodobacteraceae bacterium KLH11]
MVLRLQAGWPRRLKQWPFRHLRRISDPGMFGTPQYVV